MRYTYSILLFVAWLMVPGASVFAQSQSLSVTPPLFQLSVDRGDVWQSSVKVVNTNSYPLRVRAEVVNFAATGEVGQGRFIPIEGDRNERKTLAEWIEVPAGLHTVPAEQSKDIPFFVDVPEDAAPGGHYAAILISTESGGVEGQVVQTVQTVTSLFFLRIEGEVSEIGTIREFRALDPFIAVPDATLSLRFENKGNVHLQPKGDIIITNMWGTERGRIPVNYRSNFGNVLPNSIRDFTFTWKSDFRLTDVGRYTAVATLAYGEDGIKSASSEAHFWIIPVKGTLLLLAVLGTFVALIVLMVRAYIRRMLALAGVGMQTPQPRYRYAVSAPIQDGVLDLRSHLKQANAATTRMTIIKEFVIRYRRFFLSILGLIGIGICVFWYAQSATDEQSYEVHVLE